ncbi:MAG TPA: adenosylcobinamide-GDP ribazoletransferase [Amaricoccus sp.]|nr:adenosylcobinamide-GDP ribazoletransferase [Amaricoccus sp.]
MIAGPFTARLGDEATAFLLALGFLTRLPVGRAGHTPSRMAAATGYFPAAGLLVGLFAALVLLAASRVLPPVVALLLATAATCLLTGALHEDGLADTADGIGGGRTPARALEIMRDSRIGTYGALALGLSFALRIAALAAMPLLTAAAALIAAHAASRATLAIVIATGRYARPEGAGSFTAGGLSSPRLALALATGLLGIAAIGPAAGWLAALGALAGLAAGLLLSRGFERRLGGYTGDTLGATQQLSETALLLGMLACL